VTGRRSGAGLLAGLLLAGCASSKVYLSENYSTLRRVAVLPASNMSNDLDGPVVIRRLIHHELAARGVELIPLEHIDEKLREQGFTDGGQLRAATPQQLGVWTGADALFYPAVEDFSYINVGFYWQRRVRVGGKLVDAGSGEKLWEAERAWQTQELVTNKEAAKRQFAIQLAAKAVEKMIHAPLQVESKIAVDRLLSTLPHRR
jgi:hypothetical protein